MAVSCRLYYTTHFTAAHGISSVKSLIKCLLEKGIHRERTLNSVRDPSLGWIEGIETDDGTVLLTFFVSCHKTPDYSEMRRQHNEWRNESKAHWTLHTHSKFQQIPNVNVVVGMRLNYYGTFSMQFMVGWDWPHQTLKTEVCASKTAKIQTRWKWMCIKSPHSTSSIGASVRRSSVRRSGGRLLAMM